MKYFSILALFLCSLALPSGKLHLTGNYYTADSRSLPSVGLSVFEPLILGLSYDGYLGLGVAPRHEESDVYWMTSRNDLVLPVSADLDLSVGFTLRFSEQKFHGLEDESNVHAKAIIYLWE